MIVRALEMGVKLEIIDVVFTVTRGKADHHLPFAQQPQHSERNLAIVSGDHLNTALTDA